MKIFEYRGRSPNFGDALNSWLWPKLLPDFFDDDASTVFIGIGSMLGEVPAAAKKIIFGAGYVPGYHPPPIIDDSWHIYFVRGPRTAARLNLAPELAIGDAAILLRTTINTKNRMPKRIAFMPHWESMARGNWQLACEKAGITLIDPRQPVDEILLLLLNSKRVIAEAMHGAIIADALRIPWVPVAPLNPVHREKWYDWSESLNINLKPCRLWPSTLEEMSRAQFTFTAEQNNQTDIQSPNALSRIKSAVQSSPVAPWLDARLTDIAAANLHRLSRHEGMLSSDAVMERITEQMLEKLAQLRHDYTR